MPLHEKKFLDLFDFMSIFAWTFLNFLAYCVLSSCLLLQFAKFTPFFFTKLPCFSHVWIYTSVPLIWMWSIRWRERLLLSRTSWKTPPVKMKWLIMIMMEMVLLFWSASNYWYSIKVLRVLLLLLYQDESQREREKIFWDLQWQKTMNNLRCRRHAWKHKEEDEEEEKKLEMMIQTKHENHQRDMWWNTTRFSVTNRFFLILKVNQTEIMFWKKIGFFATIKFQNSFKK